MPKKFKGTPAQERALSAYVKLERAASAAFAYARVGLEEEGLTLSQFAVLEALYHVGPQCLGDLARRILTSSGNLTLVIDNLQKRESGAERAAGQGQAFCPGMHHARGREADRPDIPGARPPHHGSAGQAEARRAGAVGRSLPQAGQGEEYWNENLVNG